MWNNNSNTSMQNNATEVDNSSTNWKTGQNCVPVMLGHLIRHGEDFKLWGTQARMIKFLAIVDRIDVTSTKVDLHFRDETGSMTGVKWIDVPDYECPVKVNAYARVYGSVRRHNNENYVLILNIQPMQHLNELCVHLLEVTFVCLEGENQAIQSAQNHYSAQYNNSSTGDNSSSTDAHGNLSTDQILIMDIISHGDPEDGAERAAIKAQVPSSLVPQVDRILEFLSSEGHIYTTKTDDYFKRI